MGSDGARADDKRLFRWPSSWGRLVAEDTGHTPRTQLPSGCRLTSPCGRVTASPRKDKNKRGPSLPSHRTKVCVLKVSFTKDTKKLDRGTGRVEGKELFRGWGATRALNAIVLNFQMSDTIKHFKTQATNEGAKSIRWSRARSTNGAGMTTATAERNRFTRRL